MISVQWKTAIINILREKLDPSFVFIFGSYANGTPRVDSDLDIAYFSNCRLSNYERFLLAGDIAAVCKVDVDLVDLRLVDTVFAAQIFATGELIDCLDQNVFVKERMRALSMYAALNEQRAVVLKAIEQRGSVYGES